MQRIILFSLLFSLQLAIAQDCETPKVKSKESLQKCRALKTREGKYFQAQNLLRKIKDVNEIAEVSRLKAIA